jgi:hypothetical protein
MNNFIIGIGGTGLSAIRELRRLLAERFERGLSDRGVASTRFLYIDTDDGDISTHQWIVMGKDISLKTSEILTISGDKLRPLVDNSSEYPEIAAWMPAIKDFVGQPGPGAKGIRPYGRLIYEYTGNKEKIKERCVSIFHDLSRVSPSSGWRFYLIAGLSGGTGSGMAFPFAYDFTNTWRIFEEGTDRQKFYSFFVLPPVQVERRHDRYHANAFAALQELNYYKFDPGLPFSNCYLVEPQNEHGMKIPLENLPLLIAQRIFLNLQGGAAQARIAGMMDNPNLQETSTDALSGRRHARCFSSFGVSSVCYPREMVAKCLAYRLAGDLASFWLAPRDYPKNVNELVRQELDCIGLSIQHVYGDSNPFGNSDHPNHAVEIENLVDERLQGVIKRQLGEHAGKTRQTLEASFRDVGIREFYLQRENDVNGAADEAIRKVRVQISNQLRDGRHGLAFSRVFVDELLKILEEYKATAVALAGETTNRQIQIMQDNLSDSINVIHANEQKLIYTDAAFRKDHANASDALKSYLKKSAGHSAGKYGLAFLSRVVPQVANLRSLLDKWGREVGDVAEALGSRLHTLLDEMEKGTSGNGKVIFDRASLDKLSTENLSTVSFAEVEHNLQSVLEQKELDLLALTGAARLPDLMFDAAYRWVLKDGQSMDVTKITLFDKLVTELPPPAKRRELFRDARSQSAIFLKVSTAEWARLEAIPVDVSCVTIPYLAGLKSADGRPSKLVIVDDLIGSGISEREIMDSEDLEAIVFVQERQGFPLRTIESLEFLASQYAAYSTKEALHIDKRVFPRLYDVYLPTQVEREALESEIQNNRKHAAEELFIIARAHGWLTLKVNQHSKAEEVRYEYESAIGPQKYVFGPDWEQARVSFLREDFTDSRRQEASTLLNQELVRVHSEVQRLGPKDLSQVLAKYLRDSLTEYEAGFDDPRYERDQAIVGRIKSRFEGVRKEVA